MRAIVYRRSEAENGSLLLNVITQNGKTKKLKIPGILKSKTRNGYFLAPATIWEFTIAGNDRETVTPKEYNLIHSPFDFSASYEELARLGELLKPLIFLRPDLELVSLYQCLTETLYQWNGDDKTNSSILTSQFYLFFLKCMGLLHYSSQCIHCDCVLQNFDRYHLYSGSICANCLKKQVYHEDELVPNLWFGHYLGKINDKPDFEPGQEKFIRQKILSYLKTSL